jgi:ABC-2 type transport system permease protein
MSFLGMTTVAGVEWIKLTAQFKIRLLLAICIVSPFGFAIAMQVQTSLPTDTLFGRSVNESAFAIPLVVLGFAAAWAFPVLASVVGGDLFAAEDRHGTWATMLTRSHGRADVFAGKALAAVSFSTVAVTMLAVSSIAAGVTVLGSGPLIDLSGALLSPQEAFSRTVLAWISILPPALGFTALAILISIATRSSAAGIGLPVVIALVMQLIAFVDGPELMHVMLITSAFGSWHGLLVQPAYYGPMVHGFIVSAAYFVLCLGIACRILLKREVAR